MTRIVLRKDIEAIRAAALGEIDGAFRRRRNALGLNADIHAAKLAEARAWQGFAGEAPILAAEAAAKGIDLSELVDQVIERAADQHQTLAELEVERQGAQAAIRAAATPGAIDAVVAPYRQP